MKRLMIFGVTICAMVFLVMAIFNWRLPSDAGGSSHQNEAQAHGENLNPDRQVLTAINVVSEGDSEFFVYNNGDPNDFFQGSQFFGTMDKLGVKSSVMSAYDNEREDFEFIAGKKSDREQFLVNEGVLLTNENRLWQVRIAIAGIVGADVRVSVFASVGSDISENGGIRMGAEQLVCEIWKLDPVGNQPVLLDRSLEPFDGLSTHAEVPPSTLTWPAGIQMGGSPP